MTGTKEREEESEKVIKGAPQNKDRKGRPLAGEAAPVDPRADAHGTRHLMEEDMKKAALGEAADKPGQGLPGEGESDADADARKRAEEARRAQEEVRRQEEERNRNAGKRR